MAKSGFLAAFFTWAYLTLMLLLSAGNAQAAPLAAHAPDVASLIEQSRASNLHASPRWQALLHYNDGAPRIVDPNFLLSGQNAFSLSKELEATLRFLYEDPSGKNVCRFPARYTWLRHELGAPALPIDDCEELSEFKRKAPLDRIALVFASEILSQPSSIMGHLFLKVSGKNEQSQEVDHAISFFTDAVTVNLPKLFYDSLIKGMNGYFTLAPYRDEALVYIDKEQRNLWAYTLKLDDHRRTLIQHHLHELRYTTFTYFFQKYNCATLVKHILAIASPEILNKRALWTTPKDVVKLAQEAGLIDETQATTANRWAIRILQDALPAETARAVKHSVLQRTVPQTQASPGQHDAQHFVSLELAIAYNNYLLEQKERDKPDWQAYARALEKEKAERHPELHLEASPHKDPLHAPQDAQLALGWQRRGKAQAVRFDFLPVSHGLADDNRSYFGENELKLFETSVIKEERTGHLALDRFIVYATASLLPRDTFTGGLSGKFRLGMDQQWYGPSGHKKALFIEGGLGSTWRVLKDLDIYGMVEGGVGHRHGFYLYATPSIGMVIREVFDMKSIVSLSERFNQLGRGGRLTEWHWTQSKYIDKDVSLILEAKRRTSDKERQHELSLMVKRIF